MTETEAENLLRDFATSKQSVHTFLNNIVEADDTTKTGNLTKEELGLPKLPVRTYKELSLFCEEIANMKYFGDYFKKMSEIQTSTSLSKEAILIKLAVTQKKELTDLTPDKKENKGWFKKKEKEVET